MVEYISTELLDAHVAAEAKMRNQIRPVIRTGHPMIDLQMGGRRFPIGMDEKTNRTVYERLDPDVLRNLDYTFRTVIEDGQQTIYTPYRHEMRIVFKYGPHNVVKPDSDPELFDVLDHTVSEIVHQPDLRLVHVPGNDPARPDTVLPETGRRVMVNGKRRTTIYVEDRRFEPLLVRDLVTCASETEIGRCGSLSGWRRNPGYLIPVGRDRDGCMDITDILYIPNVSKDPEEEAFKIAFLISLDTCIFIQDMEVHLTMRIMLRDKF